MVTRTVLGLALATLLGSAAASAERSQTSCSSIALVSVKTAKVLHRLSVPWSDAVPDGHGGWYVAGVGLGHLRHDGRLDRGWHATLHRQLAFPTLQRAGDRLYVSDGRRVFAVDAKTGARLWASSAVGRGSGARITALAAGRSALYVGGLFRWVGNARRRDLAALDARTGRVLPWLPPSLGTGAVPTISSLAVTSRRLYLGGGFETVGGKVRSYGVAALRLDNGAVTSFAPKNLVNDGVNAIVPLGRIVLIGAYGAGGAFDARTGRQLKGFFNVGGAYAIAVQGSTAYVGGYGGKYALPVGNLLAINVRTGEDRLWFPKIAHYVEVHRIAVSGDRVLVGGTFCPD